VTESPPARQLFKERIQTPVAPVRQQLVSQIRDLITSGDLISGSRITERELTEQSGASRTVVRESLRQLETEGFLRRERSRLVVAGVTLAEALEIYAIRASLEGLAAAACARRGSDRVIAELRRIEQRFREAITLGEVERGLAIKEELYGLIYEGSELAIVASTMQTLQARVRSMRATSLARPGRGAKSIAEIERLVDAIEARDPGAARAAASDHVRAAATVLADADGTDGWFTDGFSLLTD
jgi:DNA-binding GntR family transcriptional regulator